MPLPEWHPPFSSFLSFSGVWGTNPLPSMGRMQIRHFRRFHQNGPFLAGDKNTIYQKHSLCRQDIKSVGKNLAINPKVPKIENSFQDRPPGWTFSSNNEQVKRAPHQSAIFGGGSRLKLVNRDWHFFGARLNRSGKAMVLLGFSQMLHGLFSRAMVENGPSERPIKSYAFMKKERRKEARLFQPKIAWQPFTIRREFRRPRTIYHTRKRPAI